MQRPSRVPFESTSTYPRKEVHRDGRCPYHIDPTAYLEELLPQVSPDLMRQMLGDFINQILSAQADSVCGFDYATMSDTRTNSRNGYRHRQLDTRVGSIGIAVPKLRRGSFFPDWLLERRTRTERALTTVIATCYLKRGLESKESALSHARKNAHKELRDQDEYTP